MGKPGMLQFMGSRMAGHNLLTEQQADSFGKTLMMGKVESRRRMG